MAQAPLHSGYDVVIAGGAMIGSSIAWWTARNPDFRGQILVLERDPTYAFAATSHTNSCIRQQFGTAVNIAMSQFGAAFIHGFAGLMHDPGAPDLTIRNFGYLYLAGTSAFRDGLTVSVAEQRRHGAATRMMTPGQIAAEYPFYNLDGIVGAAHNTVNEGYFDGGTIFDWFRRKARHLGAEYVHDAVADVAVARGRVSHVVLASGARIACGAFVNAAGTGAPRVAEMAGLSLPVEPRRRYTFVFEAEDRLPRDLPLTIDPSGVHVRSDGEYYMAGGSADGEKDTAADPTDFHVDHALFEEKFWPLLAHRIPAFERIRLRNTWVGHYDFNTLDQNAILGPHPEVANFHFANGFSGHGLQHSPAVGRGISEQLIYGGWRTLDLSALGYGRVAANSPLLEPAVI